MSAVAEAPVAPTHADDELVRVYVWQIPVRVTHWLIAGSIVVLSVTGFYIGRPFVTVTGPAGQSFVMGWMKVIHAWTAYVFIGAVLVRVIWMFTGNKYSHWDKFISINPHTPQGLHAHRLLLHVPARQAARICRAQPGRRVRLRPGVRLVLPRHRAPAWS